MIKTINHQFIHSVALQRLQTTTGNKRVFANLRTTKCMLQEKYQEANPRLGIIESRGFQAWFDVNEDIRAGDRLTKDGVIYSVKNITKKDYGINRHVFVILEKANE